MCVFVHLCMWAVRRHDFAICRSKCQGFLFQTACTCHDCNIYEHDSLQTCTGSHVHMSITNPYKSPICAHTHRHTNSLLAIVILLRSHLRTGNQVSKCVTLHLFLCIFPFFALKNTRNLEKKQLLQVFVSVLPTPNLHYIWRET